MAMALVIDIGYGRSGPGRFFPAVGFADGMSIGEDSLVSRGRLADDWCGHLRLN